MRDKKMTVTLYQDDDSELELPGKFEVCSCCDGRGSRALHGIAITADEWNGPDWDDESRDDYMAGRYDTVCPDCDGRRVVVVLDRERCAPALVVEFDRQLDDDAEMRAIEAAERRCGA